MSAHLTRLMAATAATALFAGAAMADADRMKVVTTFTVLADMAQHVAGDAADVVSITKPGAEIHGYQPTPRDIVRAQDADLILWNGMNLELWFEQFLTNLSDVPSVTLTEGIDPIAIAEGAYEGKPNPHAWMGLYKDQLRATLEPLRQEIATIPEDKRWLVTCEGAFSYLARDFAMKELYLWPMNADQMGTPQQVRKVIDGVTGNYGGVLYVDSLSEPDGPVPSYLDLLRVTSQTIADGLSAGLK